MGYALQLPAQVWIAPIWGILNSACKVRKLFKTLGEPLDNTRTTPRPLGTLVRPKETPQGIKLTPSKLKAPITPQFKRHFLSILSHLTKVLMLLKCLSPNQNHLPSSPHHALGWTWTKPFPTIDLKHCTLASDISNRHHQHHLCHQFHFVINIVLRQIQCNVITLYCTQLWVDLCMSEIKRLSAAYLTQHHFSSVFHAMTTLAWLGTYCCYDMALCGSTPC